MSLNYYAAIDEVTSVIRDGARIDRHLHPTAAGNFYLTTEPTPGVSVFVPVGETTTEAEEREWAESIVEQCASGGNAAAEDQAERDALDAIEAD